MKYIKAFVTSVLAGLGFLIILNLPTAVCVITSHYFFGSIANGFLIAVVLWLIVLIAVMGRGVQKFYNREYNFRIPWPHNLKNKKKR